MLFRIDCLFAVDVRFLSDFMKGCIMTTKQKKWEMKVHEQRAIRVHCAELLYDRVKLLCECYDDSEFRRYHEDMGTNELDFLDDELSDTAASFLTLKAVMIAHSEKEEWNKHNIRDLIALVLKAEEDRKQREGEEKRVSWKERALAAERECERLRAELANMKESLGIVAGAKCAT